MKYLKCAGIALAADVATGALLAAFTKRGFIMQFRLATGAMSAIIATVIDQDVHQNLFDNKPLQYVLTAAEAGLGTISGWALFYQNSSLSNFFKTFSSALLEFSLSKGSITAKLSLANAIVQSLAFKCILDSAHDEAVELAPVFSEEITVESVV
jgi:hypothetical protein